MSKKKISRKQFLLQSTGFVLGTSLLSPFCTSPHRPTQHPPNPQDMEPRPETFWQEIRQAYTLSSEVINLNNGWCSPQAQPVKEAFLYHHNRMNKEPAHFLAQEMHKGRDKVRAELADFVGCEAGEIALSRSGTESLATIICGLPLQRGDEVVLSGYDYPHVIQSLQQRESREGIVLKWAQYNLFDIAPEELLQHYIDLFTPKTKLLVLTHMLNWNGELMPIEGIIKAAHERGIEVMVDAAHSFAQVEWDIQTLGCEYLGASLHKWLGAPFGTGMLYIRKDKIEKVWPMFASDHNIAKSDIRKFEVLGTRSVAAEFAVSNALEFHNRIGSSHKRYRLRQLTDYWVNKVRDLPNVQFYSPIDSPRICALATVGIKGYSPQALHDLLLSSYRIQVAFIPHSLFPGIRITPNVFTSYTELDQLVEAIQQISQA